MKKRSVKKDPNPTPRSPAEVFQNSDYEIMTDYQGNAFYPQASECVAKHRASNTFWRAVYAVRDDDSDSGLSATWCQVKPKQITVTIYEEVR